MNPQLLLGTKFLLSTSIMAASHTKHTDHNCLKLYELAEFGTKPQHQSLLNMVALKVGKDQEFATWFIQNVQS